jgi:glycosyltransferase involved in cell wall biosynthesis
MANSGLRILQVTAPGAFGGRETVVADLSSGLQAAGHQVRVLSVLDRGTDPDRHPFVVALRTRDIDVTTLVLPPRAYRTEARSIENHAASFGAQVVHSHGYRTDVVTALSRLNSPVGRVSTAHGYTGGRWKNRMYEKIQAIAWHRFDRVVAVSGPLVEAIVNRGVRRSRIRLIPNALRPGEATLPKADARAFLGIDPADRAIGWIGRISAEKGPDVALEAFAALDPVTEGLDLHFIGEGRLRRELEARAGVLGIQRRVTWHGAVENAATVLSAFDLFVLSSRTEGTPMVLLEAISAGVPIVATSVGGVPDVVSEQDAWLVPPELPEALSEAMRDALRRPEECVERTSRARDRLDQHHKFEEWIDAHETLYTELLVHTHGGRRRGGKRKGDRP